MDVDEDRGHHDHRGKWIIVFGMVVVALIGAVATIVVKLIGDDDSFHVHFEGRDGREHGGDTSGPGSGGGSATKPPLETGSTTRQPPPFEPEPRRGSETVQPGGSEVPPLVEARFRPQPVTGRAIPVDTPQRPRAEPQPGQPPTEDPVVTAAPTNAAPETTEPPQRQADPETVRRLNAAFARIDDVLDADPGDEDAVNTFLSLMPGVEASQDEQLACRAVKGWKRYSTRSCRKVRSDALDGARRYLDELNRICPDADVTLGPCRP